MKIYTSALSSPLLMKPARRMCGSELYSMMCFLKCSIVNLAASYWLGKGKTSAVMKERIVTEMVSSAVF